MTSYSDSIKPLDGKRLSVRNNHCSMETNKKIGEMRRISNSVLKVYDKDMEEMREKYGQLNTAPDSKSGKHSTPSDRGSHSKSAADLTEYKAGKLTATNGGVSSTKSVKGRVSSMKESKPKKAALSRQLSNPEKEASSPSFPRNKSTKKKSSSVKKKTTGESHDQAQNKRVSHSYCVAVVYNDDSEETTVLDVKNSNKASASPAQRKARSVSMFETPELIVEESEKNSTLDEAVMKMGVDCPYKDLIS